ncbi:hypothetical protein [Kiloniella sp.]|uniref:hypothetical protein n=1 Tax=Kiloniella sp. TaxID=1938587 RepID=UPI003B029B38
MIILVSWELNLRHLIAVALLIGMIFSCTTNQSRAAEYQVYTYHNVPPFVTAVNTGLSYDLLRYLNQHGEGRYTFKLNIVPRKRLDALLKTNSDIIVPWASPDWFGKDARTKYAWTAPLMSDGNVYISQKQSPIDVKGTNDLQDLVLGGILGHHYSNLDDEVALGRISRMNARNERSLVRIVAGGRVDVGIIAESAARYLVWEEKLEGQIYFSADNHSVYVRRIMLSGYLPRVHTFLDKLITQMSVDPEWLSIMSSYQLPPNS